MSYSHTVIGIFDSDFDAQDAVDELISHGFDRKDIDVKNRLDVNGPSIQDRTDSDSRHHSDPEKHESAITRFFSTIFGDKSEDADKHTRLAVEGGAVITVYANSVEQAARAADILDDKGAVDVDDRAAKYGYQSGTATTTASNLRRDASTSPAMNSDQVYSNTGGRTTGEEIDNLDRQTDEDFSQRQRQEEHQGPGVGSNPTGGMRSKSRVVEWRGEASSRLREDRDSETKVGW
ncbi:MAG: hypothetical protein V4717_15920 [Bacteroidota bacterium]